LIADPRFYPAASGNALAELSLAAVSDPAPAVRSDIMSRLALLLRAGDDDALAAALRATASPAAYRLLWDCICTAVDQAQDEAQALRAQLVAIPVILVAAARAAAVIPGVLPDVPAIVALLEEKGAMGSTRNFGLGGRFVPLDVLEGVRPGQVLRWGLEWGEQAPELAAAPVEIRPGPERVELRFLLGAGIVPAAAPSFLETASDIGRWGMPLTRELARQLRQPGLQLLAMPRPPVSLLRAAHAGRTAQIELAFNLFVSNTARQFRSMSGEPSAVLSAHHRADGGAELRISLSSVLDDTQLDGYCWPLHPLDDLPALVTGIQDLLRECRISDVRTVERVMQDEDGSTRSPFLRVADFDRLAQRH